MAVTEKQKENLRPISPGETRNPNGRPLGVKNRASEVSALTRQMLTDKGMNDVIVVDESNVAEIGMQIMDNRWPVYSSIEISKEAHQLAAVMSEEYPGMPLKKKHKPNTGMKLGSYKFKTKHK